MTSRLGRVFRIGYAAATLLNLFLVANLWQTPSAKALDLPSATVDVPINNTPLDPVVTPITDTTNQVSPLKVEGTDNTVGAQVDTGVALPVGNDSQSTPIALGVSASVPAPAPIVRQVVQPVAAIAQPPVAVAAPPPTNARLTSVVMPNNPPSNSQRATSHDKNTKATEAAAPFASIFSGIANFFSSGMPLDLKSMILHIGDKKINLIPIMVSIGIFFAMLVTLAGAVYATDHSRIMSFGNGRLGQFAQTHDMTEISTLAVVTVGSALIVICIVLSMMV